MSKGIFGRFMKRYREIAEMIYKNLDYRKLIDPERYKETEDLEQDFNYARQFLRAELTLTGPYVYTGVQNGAIKLDVTLLSRGTGVYKNLLRYKGEHYIASSALAVLIKNKHNPKVLVEEIDEIVLYGFSWRTRYEFWKLMKLPKAEVGQLNNFPAQLYAGNPYAKKLSKLKEYDPSIPRSEYIEMSRISTYLDQDIYWVLYQIAKDDTEIVVRLPKLSSFSLSYLIENAEKIKVDDMVYIKMILEGLRDRKYRDKLAKFLYNTWNYLENDKKEFGAKLDKDQSMLLYKALGAKDKVLRYLPNLPKTILARR